MIYSRNVLIPIRQPIVARYGSNRLTRRERDGSLCADRGQREVSIDTIKAKPKSQSSKESIRKGPLHHIIVSANPVSYCHFVLIL